MKADPIVIVFAFIITFFVYLLINSYKHYYSKEEREKRKRMENVEFDTRIHRDCGECAGYGIDAISGSCLYCNGRGFVEISEDL